VRNRFPWRLRLAAVVVLALVTGAGLGAASEVSAQQARKGCVQINGSGNCDLCEPTCAVDQVCCPIGT